MKQRQRHVYLIGIMGCGKSTVGRFLAEQMHTLFIDLDEWIVKQQGCSVSEIFENKGETHWRELEGQGLRTLSQRRQPIVMATGGGIVLRAENIRRMRQTGVVVWLDRPLDEIIESIDISKRPLLKDGRDRLTAIFEQRKERYAQAANMRFVNKYNNAKRTAELLERQLKRRKKRLAEAAQKRWRDKQNKKNARRQQRTSTARHPGNPNKNQPTEKMDG